MRKGPGRVFFTTSGTYRYAFATDNVVGEEFMEDNVV
jgi:hypothetical protein